MILSGHMVEEREYIRPIILHYQVDVDKHTLALIVGPTIKPIILRY